MTPQVGDGATVHFWSDRQAATIVGVSPSGHKVKLQYDTARRTDDRGLSDWQEYEFTRNTLGPVVEATRRKDGNYRIKGGTSRVSIGKRSHFRDPHF